MMIRKKYNYWRLRSLGLIALFLFPVLAAAQPLDSLLLEIERRNPALKALDLQYRAGLAQSGQVDQLPDPEFSMGAFVSPVETRLGPQQLRLGVSQMLPWAGTLDARAALSDARAEVVRYDREVLLRDQRYRLRLSYFELYRIRESKRILADQLALLERAESLARIRVETGGRLADVLRIQLERQQLAKRLDLLDNEAGRYQAEIKAQLGRSSGRVVVVDSFSLAAADPVEAGESAGHPGLQRLNQQQAIAEKAIALNRLDAYPSFGLGMDYIITGQRTDADPAFNGRDVLAPRVAVRLPLNKDKYRSKEQEERLRIESLDQQAADYRNQLQNRREQALVQLAAARLEYALVEEQQGTLRSLVDLLTTEYSAGTATADELLAVYRRLLDLELNRLLAVVRSRQALALYDLVTIRSN